MYVDCHRRVPCIPASKLLHLRPALPGRPAEKAVAQPASAPCTCIERLAPALAPSPSFVSRLLQILLWWRPFSVATGLDHVLTEQLIAVPSCKMDTLLTLFPAAGLKQLGTTSALPPSTIIAHVSLPPLPASSVAHLHLAFFGALGPKLLQLRQRCAVCPAPAILQGFADLDNICHQPSALLGG
jgi:hypothetical protein